MFEELEEQDVEGSVFEAAFEGLCEGGAGGIGYDYVVGVFGGAVWC